MRGPSEWSHGERELIAAHVSRLNECRFRLGVHIGTASMLLGPAVVERLDRWREGEFDERLAATFALLERVTRTLDAELPAVRDALAAAGGLWFDQIGVLPPTIADRSHRAGDEGSSLRPGARCRADSSAGQ